MSDDYLETRAVHGLTVTIDTSRCAGYMACRSLAPEAFELDAGGVVGFAEPELAAREQLIEACRACPAQALSVRDASGEQLVP